ENLVDATLAHGLMPYVVPQLKTITLVLDEATCHLDPATEHRAEAAFTGRPGTLIVIAHRMSSAVRARRVVLMDGTRVLTGSHHELVRESPLYADLVGHWAGGDPSAPHHALPRRKAMP
ncbi:hypothetical protein ACFQ08_42935, partial [Streptosporangium algeriense]